MAAVRIRKRFLSRAQLMWLVVCFYFWGEVNLMGQFHADNASLFRLKHFGVS